MHAVRELNGGYSSGKLNKMKFFLERGADPYPGNHKGETPVDIYKDEASDENFKREFERLYFPEVTLKATHKGSWFSYGCDDALEKAKEKAGNQAIGEMEARKENKFRYEISELGPFEKKKIKKDGDKYCRVDLKVTGRILGKKVKLPLWWRYYGTSSFSV